MTFKEKMQTLKAWSSGKAYSKPNFLIIEKRRKGWTLSIGRDESLYCHKFFGREKQLLQALETLVKRLKI